MNDFMSSCHRPHRHRHQTASRRGATLLDVGLGSMLLAMILIPSMKWIADAEAVDRRLELNQTTCRVAKRLIDDAKLTAAADFDRALRGDDRRSSVVPPGTVDVQRIPPLTQRVRTQADPVYPDLLTIRSWCWFDANGNGRFDIGETGSELRTQWSRP